MTVERQLDGLEAALTPRERAQVVLCDWAGKDTEIDHRLMQFCPQADRADAERIINAVGDATTKLHQRLAFCVEWLEHDRTRLHWLRSLLVVRGKWPGGQPWSFERALAPVFETAGPASEKPPPTWADVPAFLGQELVRTVSYRWTVLLGLERMFAELSEALGADCTHYEVREYMDRLGEQIEAMQKQLVAAGFPFELPDEPGDELEAARAEVRWDDIREKVAAPAKRYIPETRRAEIEGLERERAETLRART